MRNKKGQFIKGYHPPTEFKKGCKSLMGMLGKKQTQHQKDILSKKLKGKIPKNLKMLHEMPRTEDRRNKHRLAQTGEKGSNWRGGISPLVQKIRKSFKYRQWRSDVFERDNYTCVLCEVRGGIIHADHIKPFNYIFHENLIKTLEQALNCEEFWNINNGRTLCRDCHIKTETWGAKLINSIYFF